MSASHTVGLSIALVDGQRTVWARGFGWADRAAHRPVTASTLFHIGSTSKTMTAAAVMQLVQQGRVDLDAPLSRYVPQFKLLPRFAGNVITVRSVLDMHSGIPGDDINGMITQGKPYPGFNSYLLRALAHTYPERRVKTAWSYSNGGYVLLQNLVQNVTGQSFATYTREHLFVPMGMRHTTFDDAAVPYSALSHGYRVVAAAGGGIRALASPREYVNGWATGSVVSSAMEMAAYLKTLIADGVAPADRRILARRTLQDMLTPQTRLPLDVTSFRVGLGWTLGDTGNSWMGPAVHWNGGTATFHTFFRWLPKLGVGVFVSVNTPTTASDDIGLQALGLMVTATTGRTAPKPPLPARVVKVPARTLRDANGRYALAGGGVFIVTAQGGGLLLTPPSSIPGLGSLSPIMLLPRADGWYVARESTDNPLAGIWFKPATVAGRRVLLAHYNYFSGPAPNGVVATFAEELPSRYRIPQAWRARIGTYRATNVIRGTVPELLARSGRLTINHGVLEWNGVVENPSGPSLAFSYGLGPSVARGAGEALIAAGSTLTVLGVTYQKVNPR
jgi:CubicO group peptidase (beta-lactamase class C family)